MKLIHHGGYNDQERDAYKEIIFSNTIQSMRSVFSLPLPGLALTLFSLGPCLQPYSLAIRKFRT